MDSQMVAAEAVADVRTCVSLGSELLGRLTERLALPVGSDTTMTTALRELFGDLATHELGAKPPWPCCISDDGSPFEFSLVLDGDGPEVRVLWESQGASGDLRAKADAGLATQRRLVNSFGVTSRRFDTIADLFLPSEPQGSFVLWHAARLWPADVPEIKAYMNPQVRGRLRAPALVEEALARLGFGGAWPFLLKAMPRGPEVDEIRYFSLDLRDDATARVKVYVYHHDPSPSVLLAAAEAASLSDPARVVSFFYRVTDGRAAHGGFCPATCLSFVADAGPRPVAATLHVPIRGYVRHDAEACERIDSLAARDRRPAGGGEVLLDHAGVRLHRAATEALRRRPLQSGVGLTTYVSLRSQADDERVTCYLATEAYAVEERSPDSPEPRAETAPVERMVELYENEPLSLHPFFQRMAREVVDPRHMWLMFRNIYDGLSQHFPRRLANVIARVDDDRIRSILAEQLHEELGSGDYTRAHRRLFLQMLAALDAWKPAEVTDAMLQPGARLSARLEAIYYDHQPYVGVGAAIVIELLGKQVDLFVAAQFRRQEQVGLASLEWLTLHESLELDHANESMVLAAAVDEPEDRRAAWRGGRDVYATGWAFFDEMYVLCFGA
jgi:pyrroloquinoline quinone (PQQ) biosynthesis protein C